LLQLISGVIEPDNGFVKFENHVDRLGEIAYMQQSDLLFPWLDVKENLLLPLKIKNKLSKNSYDDMIEKSNILGIYEYLSFYPHELSGGLKQRVAFLRTILQDSEFILLDEPFASLDAIKRIEIYSWIENLKDYINKLQTSNVFLSCSRSEGWNLPLIEAMACGIPSIYSDCSGQLEFAKDKGIPVKVLGEKSTDTGNGNYYEPDFNDLSIDFSLPRKQKYLSLGLDSIISAIFQYSTRSSQNV